MNPLRFIKRLPVYWNRERNYQEHLKRGWRHEVICYDETIRFTCPNDALVFSQFQNHVFEIWQRNEVTNFLRLAAGCTRFIDIGASAGIMSMLFAVSRKNGSILSVEPEPRSLRLLTEARRLNAASSIDWKIAPCVLAAEPGQLTIDVSELGATVLGVNAEKGATQQSVLCHSLRSLCSAYDFKPDLLKIDIESYEYEVVTSSRELLAELMPRIQLELHVGMIRARGLDPLLVVRTLFDLGYSERRLGRTWSEWKQEVTRVAQRSFPVTHFWFRADS